MAGRAKAVSEEYKSALLDLTFNSKPMINLLTMLAEENNEYAQCIVNVICERIKQVVNEQKMPALYLLDSILKNIGREYMAIISKNIVEVFCCVFETAPDERKRMQLFKLRNTWNQYIPNKTLYELDVRITRTDPNWPVAALVVTTAQVSINSKHTTSLNVIHVNPKFLQKSDPSATTISATLAASIVAEKEASKLQSKINKQRLLEEEKRVQEQLRILQADKVKRDREQHELVLRRQQQERECLIAEQKRQLEVLRKQQQSMSDAGSTGDVSKSTEVSFKVKTSKTSDTKVTDSKVSTRKSDDGKANLGIPSTSSQELPDKTTEANHSNVELKKSPATEKGVHNTVPAPNSQHVPVKDPRLKNDMAPNDPRVNRNKSKVNKSVGSSPFAVNVLNKIVTNLSTKKGKPDNSPQMLPVRKIRPFVNPMYSRSPVSIATASLSFASSSYNTLNLSVSSTKENIPSTSSVSLQSTNTKSISGIDNVGHAIAVCSVTQSSCSTSTQSPRSSSVRSKPSVTKSITVHPNGIQVKLDDPVCTVTQSHGNVIMSPSCVAISNPSVSADLPSVQSQCKVSIPSSNIGSIAIPQPSVTVASTSKFQNNNANNKINNTNNNISVVSISASIATPSESNAKHSSPVSSESKVLSSSVLNVESKSLVKSCSVENKNKASLPAVASTELAGVISSSKDELAPAAKINANNLCSQSVTISQPTISTDAQQKSTSQSSEENISQPSVVTTSNPIAIEICKTPDIAAIPITTTIASGIPTVSSENVPPPFSGAFKKLSTRDMQLAAQAAAIATAMHQMQSGTTVMAPEQSAQLAAQLIEIMHAQVPSTSPSTSTTTVMVSTAAPGSQTSTVSDSKQQHGDTNQHLKENPKVKEINQSILKERSGHNASLSEKHDQTASKSKKENLTQSDAKSNEKVRERSPHEFKRETRYSRQRSEGKDDEKLKSPERNLRSRTRERDKVHILGEEPPSKRLKDTHEQQERGRKARARSPSRYYNRMERKIESAKRVEEKEKELVLERFRKVSEGDSNELSKGEKETGSTGKERKSPVTVSERTEEEKDLEIHYKVFNTLKDKLIDIHKKKDQTGTIDQDMLTKIMAEVDHKAKDGMLLKEHNEELMWEIRHIRAESKHMNQKPAKGKMDYVEHKDPVNEHLHWRSRRDLSNDMGQGPPERFGGPGEPRRPPFDTSNGPERPDFPNRFAAPHGDVGETGLRNGPSNHQGFEAPMPSRMNDGPPLKYMGDRPPPPHFRDGPPPSHMQSRPGIHDIQHMRDAPPESFMADGAPHQQLPHRDWNDPHMMDGGPPQLMDGVNPHIKDGPYPPHNMDGPRPSHGPDRMDGPRPPHMMDGPRPPHMMDGPRPPHMMDGPRPPHMMDGPRPPHMMDGPRPPHMMDGPRPTHLMDAPRPPHLMDAPRPPHLMDAPRPPHLMDAPRPPHGSPHMDGPRPPRMLDGPRPPRMMDGPRPPNMMDGLRPPLMHKGQHPNMGELPRTRLTAGPQPPSINRMARPPMDGHRGPSRIDVPGPGRMDGPYLSNMAGGPRPPHLDGPRGPHRVDSKQSLMEAPIPRQLMDVPRPPFMMEGPRPPQMEGPPPQNMNSHEPQQMVTAHPYHMGVSQSQHPNMQHWGQGHNMLNQGHQAFHNPHLNSQSWETNLNDPIYRNSNLKPTGPDGLDGSVQKPFDVSSLLGQLSAAGLLPKTDEKKAAVEEPKVVMPEIKLILDDLRPRRQIAVDYLFRGMQCSSCGERFPSESMTQYRDHLDWHFRQNRKEKDGVRKGCRAWYFNLNEWVEQTTLKLPEDAKVQNVVSEPEGDVKEESTDENTRVEEAHKAVVDNSIPVGETSDICLVCMDPLEQYWDEDREEWRYKKAVRENKKTYHYHCFVDYVPFEEDESCTPPETPLSPCAPAVMEVDESEHTRIKTEEKDFDTSADLDMSSELNGSSNMNVSSEMNTSSAGSELNTSGFADSRLTVSMMEIIKCEEKDTELSSSITPVNTANALDQSTSSHDEIISPTLTSDVKKEDLVDPKTENNVVESKTENTVVEPNTANVVVEPNTANVVVEPKIANVAVETKIANVAVETKIANVAVEPKIENATFSGKTENDVMNTLQDIIRLSSAAFTIKKQDTPTKEHPRTANVDDKVSKPRKDVENVISEILDTVTHLVVPEKVHRKHSCEVLTLHVDCKSVESMDVESSCSGGTDKKEGDEEAETAYSPYIENVDSPVYPVITTSNVTCVDSESNYQVGATTDFPVAKSQSDLTLSDVSKTVEHLVSEVTLNSEAVSLETLPNLNLFSAGLSVNKIESCVTEVGSDLNKSVQEVTTNIKC